MRFLNGAGEWGDYEEITVPGDDFQAWIRKLILNHADGKAMSSERREFPPEAIGVMLGLGMWPSTWGLCLSGDTSNKDLPYNPFERQRRGIRIACFNPGREFPRFNHPGNPLRGSVQRPRYMAWVYRGTTKRINFEWNDVWEHKTLTCTLAD